jgi:cytochrome c oxidase subunit II
MFANASNFVESVNSTFLYIVAVSVILLVLITVLMIYFVIRYSRKRNPRATNIHSNLTLEIIWTVIPMILVVPMFWYGWVEYKYMSDAPEDSIVVEGIAQMWAWNFKYDNGVESDTLYVPLNKPIKINLRSLDVNHAFFVPAYRIKKDVIAGKERMVWFLPQELGSFDVACAEYCGLNHWNMYTKVVVLPVNDYNKWLEEELIKKENAVKVEVEAPADSI